MASGGDGQDDELALAELAELARRAGAHVLAIGHHGHPIVARPDEQKEPRLQK